MGDDDDWKKLSIEDKVAHKLWKCRVVGYEEAAKRFKLIDDEKSPEYNNFLGVIKKFVIDSNAAAQEKGLEAVFAFVQNASCASKCCSDIISGIVAKVFNARPKTKQLGIDICLMYVEIEKQDVVIEELLAGFTNKQPKIVAGSVLTVCTALREFGGKVIMMKNLVKNIPTLLAHTDKTVREETKQLAIEIYKWIRDAIKPQLTNIKPVQLKELEDEWEKLDASPPTPTRYTRSQQAKMAAAPPPAADGDDSGDKNDSALGGGTAPAIDFDPWETFDPVEILTKLPKDFYEKVESKKWQERMEALENLHKLVSNPKLEPGQYGEVCAVLKKIITKDSNINVVALAGKCVSGLAKGLRKKFQTYSSLLVPAILGKFKEKKLNVVISLRDAIDACYLTTNLSSIMEDVLAHLDNKNPSIKEETCKFLTRVFVTSTPATLTKATLKSVMPALIKKLDDTVGPVRDNAAEAIGTAMKVVGERAMGAYFETLDKLKQDKVKEYFEKAELTSGAGGQSVPSPAKGPKAEAPPKSAGPPKKGPPKKKAPPKSVDGGEGNNASSKPAPSKAGGKEKPKAKGVGKKENKKKKKGDDFAADLADPREPEMPEGTVDAKAEELFGEERIKQMGSANWKDRLAAVEEMSTVVEGLGGGLPCQVIVRTLAKKPGWKDSNFQVLNAKFKMLAVVAAKSEDFSRRSAWYAISGLISKIGDIKLKTQVKETLKIFAENISLNYVSLKVAKSAEEAKNPKLQTECLVWMSESIKEFGFRIDLKPHIAFIKTCLAHTNPGVRKGAIEFLVTMYIYVGTNLRMFFEEEKPAILQQIDAEFEKVKDEKPPAPTRRFKNDEDEPDENENVEVADGKEEEEDECSGVGAVNMEDLVDRVNISDKLTDAVLAKIMDKNWKIRKEGLEEVQGFINEAKFITPEINELPSGLKARLSDNNKVLVTMAIGICKQLAECGGSGMSRHKNIILPGLIGTFSDAKPHLRKAGEEALDTWHSKIGFLPFLDNEILATAMKEANPNLKATLLGWLGKRLPNEKKLPAELKDCIPPLFSCLEDRNPSVRQAAQATVQYFMAHLGFEAMSKPTAKLDPTSKKAIQDILEKAKEVCVPIAAPGKKGKSAGGRGKDAGGVQVSKPASAVESSKELAKKSAPAKKEEKTESKPKKINITTNKGRKKDVVEDDGPPIIVKTGKTQRMKDEKALKVLKWNFSAPRDEIVDQLKEQLLPCVSPSMHSKLFNKDFKFHLEAISILANGINTYADAMVESLDLILKWVTLRFFDTNTSVLIKTLEFLNSLFTMLAERNYQLSTFEASAFIPYLVGKIGDPKDNVRKSVREICKQTTNLYPASKVFVYLMEGLQSKNSKSRMECCEELGYLIRKFGIEVCQPSPKVLKEIAIQIADRDNGVRSAALNCIVSAYNIVGNTIYKYIGKLNEKEASYLEERIKRTGKKETPAEKAPISAKERLIKERPKTAKTPSVNSVSAGDGGTDDTDLKVGIGMARPSTAPNIKREFVLDCKEVEEEDGGDIIGFIPKLQMVKLKHISEAVTIPTNLQEVYNIAARATCGSTGTSTASIRDVAELLDLTIAKISSAEMQTAMEALVQLEDVFKRKKVDEQILKRIDQYLVTSLVQFKMLFSRHLEDQQNTPESLERLLKLLLSGMLSLFDAQCYAGVVSRNVLKDIILYFVNILNDKVLEKFDESDLSIQCINRLLLRVITNSDKTNCLGACIRLLQELCENPNSSQTLLKLVMKCVWKLTHLLPDFINEVKLDVLLLDIHTFYKVLPVSFWKVREDRVPQQTVKALLQTLCKLRANELSNFLHVIEDKEASEVSRFVLKHCARAKLAQSNPSSIQVQVLKNDPQVVASGPTGEVLIEIFRKIGSKENSRTGILELYHFKKKYPTIDVEPFIKDTSPFFRSFIERSLQNIAMEDRIGNSTTTHNDNAPHSISSSDSNKMLDRLNVLRRKIKETSKPETSVGSKEDISSSLSGQESQQEQLKEVVPDVTQEIQKKKNFDLDDIKRRLELIKTTKR